VSVVLFFFEWRLAFVVLGVTPLLVAIAYRYSRVAHPTLRDVQQKLADVATVVEENIVGVHVVKAFAQEPAEEGKFEARNEALFQQTLRANRQRAMYVPLLSFLPLVAQAAVLLVGARMVAHGSLTVGSFVSFNLYLALIGHTGSGKTTLASLIPRFYDVTAGSVLVDGVDVRDWALVDLRGAIGVIALDPFLFSTTVRENIAFGRPELSDEDVERVAR